jgi:hypothetical protein
MTGRTITGDCLNCESAFDVSYEEELTSAELPEYCPFCGEPIESISEDYIEDVDLDEDDLKWE